MPSKAKPKVSKAAFALAPSVGDRFPVSRKVRHHAYRDNFYEALVDRISAPRLFRRNRSIDEVLAAIERAAIAKAELWEAVYDEHPQLRGCHLGLRNSGHEVWVLALPSEPKLD